MLETILLVVVVAFVAFLIYAARRPDRFSVARSVIVAAPAEAIYPLIADFHGWTRWSPYERLDPDLRRTYDGAAEGVGAVYAYEGGPKVGAGRMEITSATPPKKIVARLDFIKPMRATNTAEWTLAPEGGGTRVTWAMHGPQTFVGKAMGSVFNMDRLVGGQFQEGLDNLKRVVEADRA